ncbi:LADA_0B01596g1_1 [Lachancea dasiensis]|uniref:Glutamyl-tRNA(Gln) amidotransferase subunit A, mitochondrial n=1 Tax=Lachancea dasiensis TaxID=1072105 RepID=A0A1G4ISH5_9SACH|nr:LADA_0B01596g1_1 [Lachancea dasiensis]
MSFKAAISRLNRLPLIQKEYNFLTSVNHNAERQLNESSKSAVHYPLKNLLCAIKDNIATSDLPTTCASKVLENYTSPFNATIVDLLKTAGAVSIGKTNLDEFGMGSGGTNSHFGATRNPLFPQQDFIVGGSSSGSAAAVAADVVDFSIGTDTGGSVRLPAAFTSIYGFKPSYGRISRYGVVAYAQSLDTVGIMSKSLDTIEKVFEVLNKSDQKDPTCLDDGIRSRLHTSSKLKGKLRVGLPLEFTPNGIPKELQVKLLKVLENIQERGHEIFPVSIPDIKNSLPIYYTLATAEAASNLSRYDGVRYGMRELGSDIIEDILYAPTRAHLGQEVKNRIVLGNHNLSSESFNNHYIKAQKLRVKLIDEFDHIFKCSNVLTGSEGNEQGVDVLLCLSSIGKPIPITKYNNATSKDPINCYINDIFTTPISLAGLPAISIPTGPSETVGVQLVGQFGDDFTVLRAAREISKNIITT